MTEQRHMLRVPRCTLFGLDGKPLSEEEINEQIRLADEIISEIIEEERIEKLRKDETK